MGSINVVEIVHMPRPGAPHGRIGQVGNAFVLSAFAEPRGRRRAARRMRSGTPASARYRRLVLAADGQQRVVLHAAPGSTRRETRCWSSTRIGPSAEPDGTRTR